ncbi:putative baseplate assembly protein [Streptoalloteichus hindustanus]|uniref:Putative baseplate assembly protein n=1 Tax=Streptoalloteichus hindustanus TaxID=2017 RepID=A0A1M4YW65_STRHI|nr:putative baseplate assembly protein [Streptoalloteichus hindustanus]SHF09948.1 putative baseplate assembly protein [Streptoalloteichus hindustanus]
MTGCGCQCCQCCQGTDLRTPVEVVNPPALSAVAYRTGTHPDFLDSMRARLSSPAHPALRDLTVRTPDDPAIGLLDAGAVLADLLTFVTERIANEGYLRTAVEERSLVLLGRLVGHHPRPGVAAGTYLAYTVDADPRQGNDFEVRIPLGSRTQSVPGPGQEPQVFETGDDLVARAAWNELKVRRRRPYQITPKRLRGRESIHVAGVATNLGPGDRLLFVFGSEVGRQELVVVPGVELDRDNDITVIGLPRPALATLELLATRLETLLEPLVEPDRRPDEVRRSAILNRFVDDVIVPLWNRRKTLDTPTKYADALAEAMERLAETITLAQHYRHVGEWLKKREAELSELRRLARQLEPPQPPEAKPALVPNGSLHAALDLGSSAEAVDGETDQGGGNGAPSPAPPTSPAVLGLGALLGALRAAPGKPPGSARDLTRDPAKIFAPGSDLGAQLLAALDPRLRDGLYRAWRRVDLTRPLALQSLIAMRAVATPFGATAPLKAVPRQGGGVDHEEWALDADLNLSVKVPYGAAGPTGVELTFQLGANAWREVIDDLKQPGDVDFGPGSVRYAVAADTGELTLTFLKHLPERRIGFGKPAADKKVRVRLPDDGQWQEDLTEEFQRTFWHHEPKEERWIKIVVRRVKATDKAPAFVELSFETRSLVPSTVLTLDAVYEGVGVGSWVVIERPRKLDQLPGDRTLALVMARVTDVRTVAKQAFGMSGKVTELVLDRPWLDRRDTRLSQIRDTTIYLRGDDLALATEPVTEDVGGDEVELAELYDGLAPGRWLIVSGERADIPGKPAGVRGTELAMIAGVRQTVDPERPGDAVHTTIVLANELAYRYRRETVTIHGNVVRATNGATREEPIGSGDAGKPNQSFALRQGPLTWLAADTPLGAASTLEVRVDGVRWHEVDGLAGRRPDEHVYVTGPGEKDTTKVSFGDGAHGARLPTGVENVRARYRVGLGRAGNVAAGQITQITTRPLGVSGVTNPLPATGGTDRDDAGLLRRNIPLRVSALDRLVSVPDYADFARARAGIGRADARRLFDGEREIVHVTVSGVDDVPLFPDSEVVTTLRRALVAHGDAQLPVTVAVREIVMLVVVASVRVHPDHSWKIVEPAVRAALLDRLGFRRRELGQPAYLSEVLAAAQAVSGVDAVDVDVFTGVPGNLTPLGLLHLAGRLTTPETVVPARLADFAEERYTVDPPPGSATETLTAVAAKHGITVAELVRLNPDITDATPLPRGRSVVVFRGVRPAQLVLLSPTVPDTLILKEAR